MLRHGRHFGKCHGVENETTEIELNRKSCSAESVKPLLLPPGVLVCLTYFYFGRNSDEESPKSRSKPNRAIKNFLTVLKVFCLHDSVVSRCEFDVLTTADTNVGI
jgi:hypothetical protein